MFLYFSAAKHLIRRNQAEFSMVWYALEKYQPRKKEYFKNSNVMPAFHECRVIN